MASNHGRGGWRWIAMVFALIGANMTVCAVTVVAARRSQPPIEGNYDAKALAWDESASQRAMNSRLGWRMRAEADRSSSGETTLVLQLLDSEGRGIRIADVSIEVRAEGQAIGTSQVMTSGEDGRYTAPMARDARGWWEVQVVAQAGGMKFCEKTRVHVPEPGAQVAGGAR